MLHTYTRCTKVDFHWSTLSQSRLLTHGYRMRHWSERCNSWILLQWLFLWHTVWSALIHRGFQVEVIHTARLLSKSIHVTILFQFRQFPGSVVWWGWSGCEGIACDIQVGKGTIDNLIQHHPSFRRERLSRCGCEFCHIEIVYNMAIVFVVFRYYRCISGAATSPWSTSWQVKVILNHVM